MLFDSSIPLTNTIHHIVLCIYRLSMGCTQFERNIPHALQSCRDVLSISLLVGWSCLHRRPDEFILAEDASCDSSNPLAVCVDVVALLCVRVLLLTALPKLLGWPDDEKLGYRWGLCTPNALMKRSRAGSGALARSRLSTERFQQNMKNTNTPRSEFIASVTYQ